MSEDYYTALATGRIPGREIFFKFGQNSAIGTAFEPVTPSGVYQTPTAPVNLELISTSTDDTAEGSGAQEVTISYLDGTGALQSQTRTTNGTSAVALTAPVWRLLRWYVSRTGTYASQSAPSQLGALTLRVAGAGAVWDTLPLLDTAFGSGQSLIACYTVPLGKSLYLDAGGIYVESTKVVTSVFFERENALDVTTPFTGTLRTQAVYVGNDTFTPFSLKRTFAALTDVGFMCKAAVSANVSIEFFGTLFTL